MGAPTITSVLRIKGSAGTDPQGKPPGVPVARPTAKLLIEEPNVFVEFKGERIPLDTASAKRVIGNGQPTVRVSPNQRPLVDPALRPAIDTVRRRGAELQKPGVVSVRPGYKFENGRITKTPCIVVTVEPGSKPAVPAVLEGLTVTITSADPYELAARGESAIATRVPRFLIDDLLLESGEATEAARRITYRPPPGASLPEVQAAMSITCHVSPDAGWKVLEPFMKGTQEKFVLGMYDFTAPHIFQTARSLLRDSGVTWEMTLGPKESLPGEDDVDSTKANDLPEQSIIKSLSRLARDRFQNAFARVGASRTFASAYHIKVGVRDGSAFWLSSGNWQSSNQPDIDFLAEDADRQLVAKFNREWHVVIENEKLAEIFETYLKGDFQTASSAAEAGALTEAVAMPDLLIPEEDLLIEERAAKDIQVFAPKRFVFTKQKPLRVQPILSPDNYVEIVTALLRDRPKKTLYFQNQSLNPILKPTPEFTELMQLMTDYSNDETLDVRIIFRNIGPVRKKLESLQAAGFNMERIRMQAGCHTKGIVIDSKTVLLGSHNFTNDGVQFNRDASLLIRDAGIAKYYEDVFLHDWDRMARSTIQSESTPRIAGGSESGCLNGYVRVPWSVYDELD